jgi:hypothetical protein
MHKTFFQILIALSALLLLYKPLAAQNFNGGFFVGLNMSQVDGENYSGYDKVGFNAGSFITTAINREFDFRLELRYTEKGAFKKSSEFNPEYYKVSMYYVEMPLLIQYTWKDNYIFSAGLSPDVILHHTEEDENGPVPPEDHPDFKRFSIGANIDAAYAFTDHLMVGARFSYSLLPVREHGGGVSYRLNRGWYNNVLSLSAYYSF